MEKYSYFASPLKLHITRRSYNAHTQNKTHVPKSQFRTLRCKVEALSMYTWYCGMVMPTRHVVLLAHNVLFASEISVRKLFIHILIAKLFDDHTFIKVEAIIKPTKRILVSR